MAVINYKVTTWNKMIVPDDKVNDIIKELEEGIDPSKLDAEQYEIQYGTYHEEEEFMKPIHKGSPTIEIYEDNGDMIDWDNSDVEY